MISIKVAEKLGQALIMMSVASPDGLPLKLKLRLTNQNLISPAQTIPSPLNHLRRPVSLAQSGPIRWGHKFVFHFALCRQKSCGSNTIKKPRPFSRTELSRTVAIFIFCSDRVSATCSKYFHCPVPSASYRGYVSARYWQNPWRCIKEQASTRSHKRKRRDVR